MIIKKILITCKIKEAETKKDIKELVQVMCEGFKGEGHWFMGGGSIEVLSVKEFKEV